MRYLLLCCFFKTVWLYSQIGLSDGYQVIENQQGIKTAEGLIENGLPTGLWINYYLNNNIKSKGLWRAGELDSIWVFYTPEGKVERSIAYQRNLKNGPYLVYDTSEQISFEGFYINDTLQGPYSVFENGVLIEEGNYLNGNKDGSVRLFTKGILTDVIQYDQGEVSDQIRINQKRNGKKQGKWIEIDQKGNEKEVYYENGVLQDYSQIKKHINFVKEKDENGRVVSQVVTNKGLKEGYQLFFNEKGEIHYAKIFRADTLVAEGKMDDLGREDSTWIYYEGNVVSCRGNFTEGAKNGLWTYYFPSGKIEQSGYYKANQLSGTWNWYYPDGTLRSTENYFNGKREGIQEDYNEKGELIEKEQISYSRKEGEQYYFIGDHLEKGEMQNGLRQGLWIYKHDNGKKAFKGKYKDGIPEGRHRYWFENGKRSLLEHYKEGKLDGLKIEFNKKGGVKHTSEYRNGELIRFDGEFVQTKLN